MTTAAERIPVPVNCGNCDTAFETTADTVCRCPNCHKAVRIPAVLRRERDRSQASGTLHAAPQVRTRPEPEPAPAPVIPLRPKASVAKRNAPEPIPDDDRADSDDWPDDDDYEEQLRRARLDMVAAAIRSHSYEVPGPVGPIQMGLLPRAVIEDFDTGFISGTVPMIPANRRGRSADNVLRCNYCSRRAGVSTARLYRLHSPAISGERIVCELHMQAELNIPGTVVKVL